MAEVFRASHEAGTFAEYTTSVTDSGDLSIAAEAALAGTGYGMKVLIDNNGPIYAYKNLGSANTSGVVRYRFYIDPNSVTMGTDEEFNVMMITDISSNPVAFSLIRKSATSYQMYASIVANGGSHNNLMYRDITDAPHYVEILCVRATTNVSSDGYMQMWIDGVLKETKSGINNYTQFNDWQLIIAGANSGIDPGTSGVIYLDEIVVRDDATEIGPVPPVDPPVDPPAGDSLDVFITLAASARR